MKNLATSLFVIPLLLACSVSSTSPNTAAPDAATSAAAISPYDVVVPPVSEHVKNPTVLSFSKTREWRHEEGIAGLAIHLLKMTREKGYGVFSTENAAIFNDETLKRFDLIVMNNFTGDGLSPAQEAAFQRWVEAGGALLAIHGSGDASHEDWGWYKNNVIGPKFIGHPAAPQFQEARVEMLDTVHPVAEGIPAQWLATDEWYSFDGLPEGNFRIIAGLDESTYSPVNTQYGDISDLRMGEGAVNHPIIWSNCLGDGRVLFSAIGHKEDAYDNQIYTKLLSNAFDWVVKKTDAEGKGC